MTREVSLWVAAIVLYLAATFVVGSFVGRALNSLHKHYPRVDQ